MHAQVRAQSLQELVYKQGTAGITKATVSIVFANDDPKNGPSGYEDKEFITVTRQVGSVDCDGTDCMGAHAAAVGVLTTSRAPPSDRHRRQGQVPHQRQALQPGVGAAALAAPAG
jgi:hypothetical protein